LVTKEEASIGFVWNRGQGFLTFLRGVAVSSLYLMNRDRWSPGQNSLWCRGTLFLRIRSDRGNSIVTLLNSSRKHLLHVVAYREVLVKVHLVEHLSWGELSRLDNLLLHGPVLESDVRDVLEPVLVNSKPVHHHLLIEFVSVYEFKLSHLIRTNLVLLLLTPTVEQRVDEEVLTSVKFLQNECIFAHVW